MASVGEVTVTLNMDDAVKALDEIRNKTIIWRTGMAARMAASVLKEIHEIASEVLKKCEVKPCQ